MDLLVFFSEERQLLEELVHLTKKSASIKIKPNDRAINEGRINAIYFEASVSTTKFGFS